MTIDGTNVLNSVSCASPTFCVAVDGGGNALSYDGSSWTAPAQIDSAEGLTSVSCPSASFCAAVDFLGSALTYDGSSWSTPVEVESEGWLNWFNSVSCPSSSFCATVGARYEEVGSPTTYRHASIYSGSSWSAVVTLGSGEVLRSVSCPSPLFCVAVDGSQAFTYDGSSWSAPVTIDGSNVLNSVSCASPTFCVAVDGGGNALSYDGSSWTAPAPIDSTEWLTSVSCPSASFCAAVDSNGNALILAGVHDEADDDSGDDNSDDDADPSSPGASPAPVPPPALAPIAPAPKGVGVARNVALVKGPIALLPLRCVGQGSCRGVAKLFVRVNRGKGRANGKGARRSATRKRGKRLLVIGKGRFAVAPGKRGNIRIRLNRAGKRLVRKAGRRGLRARLAGPGLRKRGIKLRQGGKRNVKRRGARGKRQQRR